MCLSEVRLEADRLPIARFGFRKVSEGLKSKTEIEMRLGNIGFEADRLAVARFGFLRASEEEQVHYLGRCAPRRSQVLGGCFLISRFGLRQASETLQREAEVAVS